MNALLLVSVAVGGAIGATARFVISFHVAQRIDTLFPLGTLIANALGCFLLGLMYELSEWVNLGPNTRAMISVGLIGALTTFSTFTLETINLLRTREWESALLNVMLSLVVGFLACALGIVVIRLVFRLPGGR